jgi:hypothetical protein
LKIKNVISLILLICLISLCFILPVNANENISVSLNGKLLNFDQPPIIQNGRILVPMRIIFEALGADVHWLDEEQLIVTVKNDIKLIMVPNECKIIKFVGMDFDAFEKKFNEGNLEGIVLEVAPQTINDKTFVPVRAISEALDVKVDWDKNTKTVLLTCDESYINDKNKDKIFVDDIVNFSHGISSIKENNDLPSYASDLPTEIQKLLKDIYNMHDGVATYKTILKQFGKPTGDKGGPGLAIPYWKLNNGTITFEIFHGVTYSNDTETWDLSKIESSFGKVMNQQWINVLSLPYKDVNYGIGYLQKEGDGTYTFKYNSSFDNELKDFQKDSFFVNNKKGKWNIKFEQGYNFDTRLEKVKDGTVMAYITFIGEKNTITIPITKSSMGIEFSSDMLKCILNGLPIRSPFTENYLPFM